MLLMIPLSWLLFKVEDFSQIGVYLGRLFPFSSGSAGQYALDFAKYGKIYGVLLLICVVFCTPLPRRIFDRIKKYKITILLLLTIFWTSVYSIACGMDDPFLYFRF